MKVAALSPWTMRGEQDKTSTTLVEFNLVFRTHYDFVWRVLRRSGLSEMEADDGVLEVFLVVARKLSDYQERGAMRAWLFAVARQVANHMRRADARRERRHAFADAPVPHPDPQQVVEQREAARALERFLEHLEEGQADVFYLSEVEGLSAPEIAAALDVPLSTVYGRQRLSRKRFERFVRGHIGPVGKE